MANRFLQAAAAASLVALGSWLGYEAVKSRLEPSYPQLALQAGYNLTDRPWRVLAFAPRAASGIYHMGGTLAALHRAGSELHLAVAGHQQKWQGVQPLELARSETRAALATLLAGDHRAQAGDYDVQVSDSQIMGSDLKQLEPPVALTFSGHPQQRIGGWPQLARYIDQRWQAVDPELVLAPHPHGSMPAGSRSWRVLGEQVLSRAQDDLQRPDQAQVYFYGSPDPNRLVDITRSLQAKIKAAECFEQQGTVLPKRLVQGWLQWRATITRGQAAAAYVEALERVL